MSYRESKIKPVIVKVSKIPGKKGALGTAKSEKDTYNDTLRAAAKLFRNYGYSATTLRQIADAVGIKAGSIYYYFDSKEDILDKVLDAGIQMVLGEVTKSVESLPPEASCRDKIYAAIRAHLIGILQQGDFTSANIRIYGQIPAGPKKRHRVVRATYASFWDKLFEECRKKGELRDDVSLSILRLFVIGALNWTVEWFDRRQGSLDGFINQISSIVFDGILNHETDTLSPAARLERRPQK